MSVFNRKKRRNSAPRSIADRATALAAPTPKKSRRQRVNANGDAAPTFRIKFRRFLYKLKHDLVSVDGIIFGLAIFFTLTWTWGAISALSRNWELAQRVESRKKELALMRLEVENLELENEYYKSAEYQELAARAKQNKLLPGETLIYLPENSEAAKTKHQSSAPATSTSDTPSNFSQWLSFLFGV